MGPPYWGLMPKEQLEEKEKRKIGRVRGVEGLVSKMHGAREWAMKHGPAVRRLPLDLAVWEAHSRWISLMD